jgi:hypothetical protein
MMKRVRNFLWKHLGITLNRKTWIAGSLFIVLFMMGVVGAVVFGQTGSSFFQLMMVLGASGAGIFVLGGSYNALDWSFSDKEGRRKIEEEIALKQWRERARDPHYEP